MFMYLGKGWRRKEKYKLFSMQNFYTTQKMAPKEVVVFVLFLDVSTCHEICIDLCLPISSLLCCYVLKLKEMVKRADNLNSTELKISNK